MILRDYLEYATDCKEVPEMFHVWGAYTVISSCVSRRVWFNMGNLNIFPNLYVMYVGDAGNGKSIAMDRVRKVLTATEYTAISNSVETPEGLLRHMNGQPDKDPPIPSPVAFDTLWPDGQVNPVYPITIIANEFVNFINKAPENWIAFLNDVYDQDNYTYRTKTQGADNLIGPYVGLIGALTTEVSSELQNARIISSGFARRTIFQYGVRDFANPCPIPETKPESVAVMASVVKQCAALATCKGEFRWSNDAKSTYERWYITNMPKTQEMPSHLRSWTTSKPIQIIKLGMLTSLAESHDLVIEKRHIDVTLAYLEIMEKDLFKIFGGLGRNELAAVTVKILDIIEKHRDPVQESSLRDRLWNDCRPPLDFDACIKHLVSSHRIVRYQTKIGEDIDILISTQDKMREYMARTGARVAPQ